MPKARFFTAYPNPYAHLDANGKLAGCCPVGEVRTQAQVPSRRFVGAERVLLEHDTKERGPGLPQLSRSEYEWRFTGEPVRVDASGQLGAYYEQRAKAPAEIFLVKDDDPPPLMKLAEARVAAFEQFKAENDEYPSAVDWAGQFPLDPAVAVIADSIMTVRKAAERPKPTEADKKAAAKAAADEAERATKAAREKHMAAARAIADAMGQPPSPIAAPTAKPLSDHKPARKSADEGGQS